MSLAVQERTSRASVKNGSGVGGDAYPLAADVNPGINKALAPDVGLAAFDAFGAKYSSGDGSVTVNAYADRLRRDLLLLGLGRFHPCQELRFGLNRAVIVDQHNPIVEECVE